MYIGIKSVKALEDYEVLLEFENGEERVFDLKPYLSLGKFSELRDPNKFKTVRVSFDTIEWDNNIDLDPEFLYKNSRKVEKALT
jgi:hypothetical protein